MLNTRTGFTTPWHCCVALTATGEWTSAPKGEYLKDPNMQIIYENGRPSYFQEVANNNDSGQKAGTETLEVKSSKGQRNAPLTELQEPVSLSLTEAERDRITALANFMMSAEFKQCDKMAKSGHTCIGRVPDFKPNEFNTVAWLKELICAAARDTERCSKGPGVSCQDIPASGE